MIELILLHYYEYDSYIIYGFKDLNSLCDFLKDKRVNYDTTYYINSSWYNEQMIKDLNIIIN